MGFKRVLMMFLALLGLVFGGFACSVTPLEPKDGEVEVVYRNTTNFIYIGAGAALAGSVYVDPAVVPKGCMIRIRMGTAYAMMPVTGTAVNWSWNTLSSNVVYAMEFELVSPSGSIVNGFKWTNFQAPGLGLAVDLTATKEIYDRTGVEWSSANVLYGIEIDSLGNLITVERTSAGEYLLRKYGPAGADLGTLATLPAEWWDPFGGFVVANNKVYIRFMDYSDYQHKIGVYTEAGVFDRTIPFNLPSYFSVDAAENFYIFGDYTLSKYDSLGNPVASVALAEEWGSISMDGSGRIAILAISGEYLLYDASLNFVSSVNLSTPILPYSCGLMHDSSKAYFSGYDDFGAVVNAKFDPATGVISSVLGQWRFGSYYIYLASVSPTGDYVYCYDDWEKGKKIVRLSRL